uniref:Growth hormone regulated TBC protein 1 n=1 Tax=Cercocebus atys TaxID=9531 RepID=A0A2K5KYW0_CERAT
MEPAERSRVPRIDPYGFERPEDFDDAAYEKFFSSYLVTLTRRAIKWSRLLQGGSVPRSRTVTRMSGRGVASVWIGWQRALPPPRLDWRNPRYTPRLSPGERNPRLEASGRCDLNRTFPDNVKFRKTTEPCLQKTLYNVLLAYGHHNQGVGYCQGMNFIAGYLILITNNEEESFWLLDALVGRILPENIFRTWKLIHGHRRQAARELQGPAAGTGVSVPVSCVAHLRTDGDSPFQS